MEKPAGFMKSIAELRALLLGMERSAGLDDLSQPERDVLCAAHSVHGKKNGFILSDEIRHNVLAERLSQPTYQRALKSLVEKGYLCHAPGHKKGVYVLA